MPDAGTHETTTVSLFICSRAFVFVSFYFFSQITSSYIYYFPLYTTANVSGGGGGGYGMGMGGGGGSMAYSGY